MRHFLSAFAVFLAPVIPAEADELNGTYRTETGKGGGVLHVEFGACDDDAAKTCGVIKAAYDKTDAPRADYPHLDRRIVWGMEHDGRGKYSGGRMWAHEANKVLKSELLHRGDALRVSGCVGPVCRSEVWVKLD